MQPWRLQRSPDESQAWDETPHGVGIANPSQRRLYMEAFINAYTEYLERTEGMALFGTLEIPKELETPFKQMGFHVINESIGSMKVIDEFPPMKLVYAVQVAWEIYNQERRQRAAKATILQAFRDASQKGLSEIEVEIPGISVEMENFLRGILPPEIYAEFTNHTVILRW
jgi:hypothetical protein